MKTSRYAAAIILGALLSATRPAPAQFMMQGGGGGGAENIEGITVTGKGLVSAKPNVEVLSHALRSCRLCARLPSWRLLPWTGSKD